MKTQTTHLVEEIQFENDVMVIKIDGQTLRFPLAKISEKLEKATPVQRLNYRISPSGYGIHWIEVDEDLSVEGLLNIS